MYLFSEICLPRWDRKTVPAGLWNLRTFYYVKLEIQTIDSHFMVILQTRFAALIDRDEKCLQM